MITWEQVECRDDTGRNYPSHVAWRGDQELAVVSEDQTTGLWVAVRSRDLKHLVHTLHLNVAKWRVLAEFEPCACVSHALAMMNLPELPRCDRPNCPHREQQQPRRKPMVKDEGTPVRLSDEELQERTARLVEVDKQLRREKDKKSGAMAGFNEELKTLREEQGAVLDLGEDELQDSFEQLVEIDRKLRRTVEKKRAAASKFNEKIKALLEEQGTLLDAIGTGWEKQNRQTEAFTGDGRAPAPKGQGKAVPPKKGRSKKTAKKTSKRAKNSGAAASA